jgi:hypothetical protein
MARDIFRGLAIQAPPNLSDVGALSGSSQFESPLHYGRTSGHHAAADKVGGTANPSLVR